jgi:ParB-like chromosome segregation protein Spo0J
MAKKKSTADGQAGESMTIASLVPDPRNARRHTPRNVGGIVNALQRVGAARSIVIDENNMVLAGNATVEAAGEAGITKMQIIDGDGETLIAVRRKGLTAKQKAELGILDNRTAELAEWDVPQLNSLIEDFAIDPKDIEFSEDEIKGMEETAPPDDFQQFDESISTEHECPKCGYKWSGGK